MMNLNLTLLCILRNIQTLNHWTIDPLLPSAKLMFLRVWVKIELNWIDWNCVTWYFRSCNVRNTFVYLTTYQSNTMFLILGNCLTLLLLPSALVCWVSWMQSWLKTKYLSDKRYHHRIAVTNILEVMFDSWFCIALHERRKHTRNKFVTFSTRQKCSEKFSHFMCQRDVFYSLFLFGFVRWFPFEQALSDLALAKLFLVSWNRLDTQFVTKFSMI